MTSKSLIFQANSLGGEPDFKEIFHARKNTVEEDTWHHVAVTYTPKLINFFLDGQPHPRTANVQNYNPATHTRLGIGDVETRQHLVDVLQLAVVDDESGDRSGVRHAWGRLGGIPFSPGSASEGLA